MGEKIREKKRVFIGLIGTIGSGKTAASDYLLNKGFYRVIFGDIVRESARKLGMPLTRKNLQKLGAGKIKPYTKRYWAEKAVAKALRSKKKRVLIDGIRKPIDAIIAKREGAVIIFIDANTKLRYRRILKRKREDEKKESFKKFREDEKREQRFFNIKRTLRYVDYKIMNNSTLADFYRKIDIVLKKILNKK